MNKSTLKQLTAQIMPETVKIRRAMHRQPELSGQEFKTAELVYTTLKSWGIPAKYHLGKTAVSARIANGKGPTIVLRADMDALPVHEENNVEYASAVPGVMHACGHDMHTAILLGAAFTLLRIKSNWQGTVLCLFQPSEEEEPGGALGLIKAGVFPPKTDAVFGLHVSADHKCGEIAIKEGHDYAGVFNFDVTVRGRGGHGATPEKAIDPILCASSIITQLQALISREKPTAEPAVLTVGSFHAGTGRNIIPDTAVFKGTVRTYSEQLQNRLMKRIRELVTAGAAAFGATAKVTFEKSYPPGYNDPALAKRFRERMSTFIGAANIADRGAPTMYAEDFARYQQVASGLYIYLGAAPAHGHGKKKMEELHSPRFLPDEKAMETGIIAHLAFVLEMLGE